MCYFNLFNIYYATLYPGFIVYYMFFFEAVSYVIHLFPHIYVFSISSRDKGFSVWFILQKLIIIFLYNEGMQFNYSKTRESV